MYNTTMEESQNLNNENVRYLTSGIGLNQSYLYALGLDNEDDKILSSNIEFLARRQGRMLKFDGEYYQYIDYKTQIERFPLNKIRTTQSIQRRFDKYCRLGIVKKLIQFNGRVFFTYFSWDLRHIHQLLAIAHRPKADFTWFNELVAGTYSRPEPIPEIDRVKYGVTKVVSNDHVWKKGVKYPKGEYIYTYIEQTLRCTPASTQVYTCTDAGTHLHQCTTPPAPTQGDPFFHYSFFQDKELINKEIAKDTKNNYAKEKDEKESLEINKDTEEHIDNSLPDVFSAPKTVRPDCDAGTTTAPVDHLADPPGQPSPPLAPSEAPSEAQATAALPAVYLTALRDTYNGSGEAVISALTRLSGGDADKQRAAKMLVEAATEIDINVVLDKLQSKYDAGGKVYYNYLAKLVNSSPQKPVYNTPSPSHARTTHTITPTPVRRMREDMGEEYLNWDFSCSCGAVVDPWKDECPKCSVKYDWRHVRAVWISPGNGHAHEVVQ